MENKETQLIPYDLSMAIIEELKKKYKDITIPPGDKNAYAMVMGGLKECREIRLGVDEWHKGKKKDINRAAKHFDSEKRRIHALVEPIETPLKEVRKAEDDRIEAERQEKIRKEQERVDGIRKQITAIQNLAIIKSTQTAADIQDHLNNALNNLTLSEEDFEEFLEEAQKTLKITIRTLKESLAERIEFEKQEAERKAEAERLEKQRQEQEAEAARIKAEQDRIAEENRKIQEEKDRIEDEKRKVRIKTLINAGLTFDGSELYYVSKNISLRIEDDVNCFTDSEFESLTSKMVDKIKVDKEALEITAKEKAEKEVKERSEREAKEKEDRERKEAEKKAKAEALKPDKEKIKGYALSLLEIAEPELSQEASRDLMKDFQRDLKKLVDSLIQEAEIL